MDASAFRKFGSAIALALVAGTASARDCAPHVDAGWIRLVPGAMQMQAGYARIDNACPTPAVVVSASSPSYGSISLHESRLVDGMEQMRPVPELRIAPDSAVVLKPGGLHLMLMAPSATLREGSRVAIRFKLADGREVLGEFQVRKP